MRQWTHFSSEVFKDGCTVYSSCGSHSAMAGGPHLEMSVYPSYWKLETCPSRPGNCLSLHFGIFSCFSTSLFVCTCITHRIMYTKDYASIVPRVVLGEGINSYGTTADTCTRNSVKQFKACCSKCGVRIQSQIQKAGVFSLNNGGIIWRVSERK